MKILIGVDDSAHSQAAVEYVKNAKWPAGTHVTVLAAVRAPVAVYAEIYASGPQLNEQIVEEQMKYAEELAARVERVLKDAGFATEARALQGDPRELIVDTARSVGADLVVVGSHGRTGLSKLMMGSVATHVVTHAPCDVLVVKRGVSTA